DLNTPHTFLPYSAISLSQNSDLLPYHSVSFPQPDNAGIFFQSFHLRQNAGARFRPAQQPAKNAGMPSAAGGKQNSLLLCSRSLTLIISYPGRSCHDKLIAKKDGKELCGPRKISSIPFLSFYPLPVADNCSVSPTSRGRSSLPRSPAHPAFSRPYSEHTLFRKPCGNPEPGWR